MNNKDNIKQVNDILNKYNFSSKDKEIFWNIIYPIYYHEEFQKRMDSSIYPHHDTVSLGNHIISDAAVAFILSKKANEKNKDVNVNIAVLMAMFHDLYELPWQNAKVKKSMYVNKHAFTHPLEGIINAATWFPEYFKNPDEALAIIDGVVHHMWPFPVRAIDSNIESLELNNENKWYDLNVNIKNLIISSSKRRYIRALHLSLTRSLTKEGRIMSDADKFVSWVKDASFKGTIACFTGENSNLKNRKR